MNLDEAIRTFEQLKNSKFSKDDISTIKGIADFLVVTEFKMQNPDTGGDHFHDLDDQMHVHPTMIVARSQFPNSVDRGPEPFPKYPFFIELSKWSGGVRRTSIGSEVLHKLCPTDFIQIPINGQCHMCGWNPSNV